MSTKRVLIVGAGPTGASLAFLLARRGIAVRLVERESSLDRTFRGEGMMPGGMDALAQMGLLEEIERLPQRRLDRWEFYFEAIPIARWEEPDRGKPNAVRALSQPHLLELLIAKSRQFPSLQFLPGFTVTDLVRDEAGIALRGRGPTGEREVRGDFVVGADGRASVVRKLASLRGGVLTLWVTAALFLYYTGFTGWYVAHQALGAELTDDHHDRSRIFAARHVAFVLGLFCAFAGMHLITNAPAPREMARRLSLPVAVIASMILLVPPIVLRERPDFQNRGARNPARALRDLLRNPHARLLLLVTFVEMIGLGAQGVLAPYVIVYVIRRPDLIGVAPAAYVVASIASIPLWLTLSRRFGKKDVWLGTMVGSALAYGSMFFLAPGRELLLVAALVVAGACSGCGGAVGPSILADVIDEDDLRTGERKEGVYSAVWGFAIKAGQGLVVLAVGSVLQLGGFRPNAEQTPLVDLSLRLLLSGIPLVGFSFGAAMFRRFSLSEAEYSRIRADLAAARFQVPRAVRSACLAETEWRS